MARTNHIVTDSNKSHKVNQVIQGTNQSAPCFEDVYQKVMSALNSADGDISPHMKRFIRSIDCPHLHQMLEEKLLRES